VNTVYCTYATPRGHALVAARIWAPPEQLDDPERRNTLGIPDDVEFQTKPQLAKDIVADMVADQTLPGWFAGDEVYGRSRELRDYIEAQSAGYVLRAGCDFRVEMTPGTRERVDALVTTHLTGRKQRKRWEIRSVPGSKGARAYAWAWLGTASRNHHVLIRKHLVSGEMAYHYCYVPPGRPVTLTTLVRVACLRWPIEETLCATRRSVVFPTQLGGTRKEVPGSEWLTRRRKVEGDKSMPGNQRSCPGAWGGALGDPRDMAKAGLLEA